MEKLFQFIKNLGFWQFISAFVLLAIVISEILIVIQSYWLKGYIDPHFLIIGFITPAIDALIVFIIAAIILESYRKKELKQSETEQYWKETQKLAQVYDWELDIESGRARWPKELMELLDLEADAPVGPEYLSTIVEPDDWPTLELSLRGAIEEGKKHQCEYRINLKNGEQIWVFCQAERVYDADGHPRLHGVLQEITEKKIYEKSLLDARNAAEDALDKFSEINLQLQSEMSKHMAVESNLTHKAMHDILTDLPNRSMLNSQSIQILAHARRHQQKVGVMFMDLDDFKIINDQQGHDIGDAVLVQFSINVKDAVRECDLVARLGGDEFVILLPDAPSIDQLELIAQRIIDLAGTGMDFLEGAPPSVSIGIALFPEHADTIGELIRQADKAMYMAKQKGKNDYAFYQADDSGRPSVSQPGNG